MEIHRPVPGIPQYLTTATIPPIEKWAGQIASWIPIYLENYGNASRVHLTSGFTMYLGRSAQQIYRDLARFYCIDLQGLRIAFLEEMGKSQYLPLILPNKRVFCAMKCRKEPQNKNDGVMGYICSTYVQASNSQPHKQTDIVLKCGSTIRLHMTQAQIRRRFQEGKKFSILLSHRHSNEEGC